MAILLKVKNAQTFIENLNSLLDNSIGDKSETWIVERFQNGVFYTHYMLKVYGIIRLGSVFAPTI